MRPSLTARGFAPPPVMALPCEARLLLRAARIWVLTACHGQSPRAVVAALLGSAGPRFGVLMDRMTAAWPEAFTTFPPCATALSPDEAALVALLARAAAHDRAGAFADLADLLAPSDIARLWDAALALHAERAGAP